jgi:hypothetical protein
MPPGAKEQACLATLGQWWAAVAIGCAVAASMIATPAMAAPPPDADPALAPWFRELRSPASGIPCCDESDSRRTVAQMVPYGWKAKTTNGWIFIPRRIILRVPNPTGEAILCWTPNRGPICFVPPPAS